MVTLISRTVVLATALFYAGTNCMLQNADQIIGQWKGEHNGKSLRIEIYRNNHNSYTGRLLPEKGDADKSATIILSALQYHDTKGQYLGTMTPPEAGITLSAVATMVQQDLLQITAKKLLMSKTILLKRIN